MRGRHRLRVCQPNVANIEYNKLSCRVKLFALHNIEVELCFGERQNVIRGHVINNNNIYFLNNKYDKSFYEIVNCYSKQLLVVHLRKSVIGQHFILIPTSLNGA